MAGFNDVTTSSFKPVDTGDYDAILHGIVWMELQNQKPYKGQERKPQYQVKFIFEIPGLLRNDGASQTMAKTVNAVTSEKGKFIQVVGKILNKSLTSPELSALLKTEDPLKDLLGKAVVLKVNHFTPDGGEPRAYIEEFVSLDPRIPAPTATRGTLYFDPIKPDLTVFKELTMFTKKQLMEAVNNKDFPTELHQAYVADLEQDSMSAPQVPASTAPVSPQGDLGAIQ